MHATPVHVNIRRTSSARESVMNGGSVNSGIQSGIGGGGGGGIGEPGRQVITPNEELVFQRMAYRKLERQLRGTYKNDKPWTILWTFLTLLLLFGLVAPSFVDYKDDDDDGKQPHKRSFDIQVNIRDLGFLSLMAVITVVTLVYTLTRVVVVVRWSLYWLLATLSVLYLWKRQINLFSNDTPLVLLVGFGVMEFITFFVYILMNFLYPPFVRSEFFRKNVGIAWWFGIRPQPRQHWTLTYLPSSWFEGRRTCTYRGETDADGLPHGFGNWLDDSFHGELLSGMWEHGDPVGPFRSREFGSGFAFESLRIGYVHCSDDSFTSRKYFPTQTKLPTLGVASVECSVAGGFFSHLPRAVIREGPYCLASILDDDPNDIEAQLLTMGRMNPNPYAGTGPHYPFRRVEDILPHIKVLYTEHPSSSLIITATRGRGVLVSGHTYLNSDHEVPQQLVIDVVRAEEDALDQNQCCVVNIAEPQPPAMPTPILPPPLDQQRQEEEADDQTTTSFRVDAMSSSLQVTDAPGSSLLLASSDDEMEDELSPDDDSGSASNSKLGKILLAQQQQQQQRRSTLGGDEATFHTPLLMPTMSQDTQQGEAFVSPSTQDGDHHANDAQEDEDNDALYFNMSHIPAATFQNQLLQQQNHLLHRPHSNVFQEARILVSQQRFPAATTPHAATTPTGLNPPPSSSSAGPGSFLPGPHLRVRGWKSTIDGHVEALIFFPGFNASLEHSLQRLGQFMAMGRFPPHIKPLVFSWPCAREATYLWAAECATSRRTHAALAALLRGLESAGVRDVHFLVHSLGAQVVCSALRDLEDVDDEADEATGSDANLARPAKQTRRSRVSRLFVDVMPNAGLNKSQRGGNLRLRTVTLLNPDTPLSSFIHKDFKGLRRVCDHITVVGDRKDGALDWSELGNGARNTIQKLKQLFSRSRRSSKVVDQQGGEDAAHGKGCCGRCGDPDSFCSSRPFAVCCRSCVDGCCRPYRHGEDRMFSRVLTVGKNIFSLYTRDVQHEDQQPLLQRSLAAAFRRHKDSASGLMDDDDGSFELLAGDGDGDVEDRSGMLAASSTGHGIGGASASSSQRRPPRRRRHTKRWLDVDVIDTSSMETNVHQLRHAYFDLNKILVEDLHELIVTGKRAAERSLLLHREGNIFSFCQAPACVVNQ